MEGRPKLEDDLLEKLESVGEDGLEREREESRLMGFEDRVSVGCGSTTVWEEGREGGGEIAAGEVGRLPFR